MNSFEKKKWVHKEWGFHCFGSFFHGLGGHKLATSLLQQLASPLTPGALVDHERIKYGHSIWTFFEGVIIMLCLLTQGISGLVQRISDWTLISFSFLKCVWSMLRYLHPSSVSVHVKRTLVRIETRHLLAFKGLISPSSYFHFTLVFGKAARWLSIIHFCVVTLVFVFMDGREVPDFGELHCKYKLFKEILSVINALLFRYHMCLMHLFRLRSIGYLKDSLFNV